MKYKFIVSLNGQNIDRCDSNIRAAKMWIRQHVLSTHMGYWMKHSDGYEYSTTIGRYYRFTRVKM